MRFVFGTATNRPEKMDRKRREVVISIRSSPDVLTISFRNEKEGNEGMSKVIDVSLDELRTTEPEKAEARVGGAILAVLEHVTGVALNLRNYDQATKEAVARADALIAAQKKNAPN